ncbi:DUF5686 and carboxypeptidase-like regulatory domain-containing protein [Mucilaginibacter myungsuensis]
MFAQSQTVITGIVTDAKTRQPLPFVTVSFNNSNIGTNTNDQGRYSLKTSQRFMQIKATYVGYKPVVVNIVAGKEQAVSIKMESTSEDLAQVDIKGAKRARYTNKDNPAVELIRQVIDHKEQNKPEAYDFVEYKAYDKLQISFVNVSEKLGDKKLFRKYKFLLDNKDTTLVPGKSLLPVYLNEKLLQTYYRKNPEKKREIQLGEKNVNFGGFLDNEGLNQYIKHIYTDVNIYDNNIMLITNQFLSPISDVAPSFYKFFIQDTVVVNNQKLIELTFTPRNTTDMLFEGKIYITQDGNFAVQKAELVINKNINLNFVKSLKVILDFEQNPDKRYHLSKSETMADFGFNKNRKGGIFGDRMVTFKNYLVNQPRPDTTYTNGNGEVLEEVQNRSEDFWAKNRLDTLTTAESKVYKNIDSLNNMPSFKRAADIATLLFAGYKSFGPVEVGPSNAFYSFNPVEGFRLRLGGRTTTELSKRYYFETFGAYGFRDEKFKYFLSATYSLNDKSIYRFPQNYIRASIQRDTKVPGQNLMFIQEDNFFLSFKRGVNDKYLYNDNYKFNYVHEYRNHFSYALGFNNWTQSPAGSLYFVGNANSTTPNVVNNLTTTEATLNLRYAPGEQFFQGKLYRIPIPTGNPIFTFNYVKGMKGVFNSSYNYNVLDFRVDKHFYQSIFGYSDVSLQANRLFGKVPFPLLTIHQANQSYAYDIESYNLMNFMEFVSDRYVAFKIDQHWQGLFLNKIPLIKLLKLRETTTFKILKGSVSENNNPNIDRSLYQYPVKPDGSPITYALGNAPYIEGSIGLENIFKVIRVDVVKRFSYLDHPDIAPIGIRARVKFDF